MTAPTIWIISPLIVAVLLFFLRRNQVLSAIIAMFFTLSLVILAWQLEIDTVTIIGPWVIKVNPQLIVAGRSFVIPPAQQPFLILFFGMLTFWFGGLLVIPILPIFTSVALAIGAIFIAALAVQPFLYAALLIEIAVLLSVVILSPTDKPVNRGVMRYLIYQTLGMLFILIAGWALGGIEARGENMDNIIRAAIFLGFGFAFLLAVFPLHTWIPMLTEHAHPYIAAFILSILLSMVAFFSLNFIERYPWLQESLNIFRTLRFIGATTILIAGIWATFQRHLGRIMGFALMLEVGRILLTISLSQESAALNIGLFIPRALSVAVWALALALIDARTGSLRFRDVQGIARRFPILGVGLIFGQFSFAGIPLLAGFPIYNILWGQLAEIGWWLIVVSLLGSFGLTISALRSLAVLVMGPAELPWPKDEKSSLTSRIFLLIGIIALFLIGIFPQLFYLPFLQTGVGALFP